MHRKLLTLFTAAAVIALPLASCSTATAPSTPVPWIKFSLNFWPIPFGATRITSSLAEKGGRLKVTENPWAKTPLAVVSTDPGQKVPGVKRRAS